MPRGATPDAQAPAETRETPTRTSTFASRFGSAVTGATVGSLMGAGGGALLGGLIGNASCGDPSASFGCLGHTGYGFLIGAAVGIFFGTWIGVAVGGGIDFLESMGAALVGLLAAAVPAALAIGAHEAGWNQPFAHIASGALFAAHNLVVFSALFGALLQGEPARVAPTVAPTVGGATVGLVGALD